MVLCACKDGVDKRQIKVSVADSLEVNMVGQDTTAAANALVFGRIRDAETGEGMRTFHVQVSDVVSSALIDSATVVDDSASYELVLDYGRHYRLMYTAPGYTAKQMLVDLRGIPEELHAEGFGMNLDVRLVEALDGVDYSVLDEPLGIAAYHRSDTAIVWDSAYMAPRKAALTKVMEEQARVRSRMTKR